MLDAPSDTDVVFEDHGVQVVMSPVDHRRSGPVALDWLGDAEDGMLWIHPVSARPA